MGMRLRLESQLQAGSFGHAAHIPRRIEHNFHMDFFHRGQPRKPALHISLKNVSHAASGSGHRHFYIDLPGLALYFGRLDLARVDQSEVDDIYRNLGIVNRFQDIPDQLVIEFARVCRRCVAAPELQSQSVRIFSVDSVHLSVVGPNRVAIAARLHDSHRRALRKRAGAPAGNFDHLAGAVQSDYSPGSHLGLFYDSVETGSCLPSSAACNVCQARVAHFTRTGNSETPENASNLPTSAWFPFAWPVTSL